LGSGLIKAEMNLTVSALQLRAGQIDAALDTARKVEATKSDPLLRLAASRAVGDAALAKKAFPLAAEAYSAALAVAVGRMTLTRWPWPSWGWPERCVHLRVMRTQWPSWSRPSPGLGACAARFAAWKYALRCWQPASGF